MRVEELIEELKKMPQKAEVTHLWDGSLRTDINIVYESKNGLVVTSDFDMVCYYTKYRPINAPTEEEDAHWCTRRE